MKALSIQQPWGTLICAGIKDVENRSWKLDSVPLTVLIHTGAKRQSIDETTMPIIWSNPIENAQTMGVIGWLKDMPTSAIIGIATIDRCEEDNSSIWAQTGSQARYKWVMRDVKLFEEPILNVKGKLGIFDIPEITTDKLPRRRTTATITRDKRHITIPLCKELFMQLKDNEADTVTLNLTEDNLYLFCTKTLRPRLTKTVTFICGEDKLEAEVSNLSIEPVLDDKTNKIVEFTDPLSRIYYWYKIFITINQPR